VTLEHPIRAVVVDASAMVEVLIGDEMWTARLADWQDTGTQILAPPHFRSEVANALLVGLGFAPSDVIGRLQQLFQAGIDIADRGLVGLFDAIELAHRHRLSVYDAAYLSLVLDVDGELATEDRALATATLKEGVAVIS
jgi:predicted nucleic acid-binding protein